MCASGIKRTDPLFWPWLTECKRILLTDGVAHVGPEGYIGICVLNVCLEDQYMPGLVTLPKN